MANTASPSAIMPRSPCEASAGWTNSAGVPVDESVAAHENLENPTECLQCLRNAVECDPSHFPARHRLGLCLLGRHDFAEAKYDAGSRFEFVPQLGLLRLADDNVYGYGRRGDGTSTPSYSNTFQRGEQESVWETVPHPSWEDFQWGGNGTGFIELFVSDDRYPAAAQWRYTNAPDADARIVQAMYWAREWAEAQGQLAEIDDLIDNSSKMGDYPRYAMFDKYFQEIGCQNSAQDNSCAASGRDAQHYLLSWYYSWGGNIPTGGGGWGFRIGSSHNHMGYQNPVAAYVLSQDPDFVPAAATAQQDWATSYQRQLEFYRWLDTADQAG